MALSRIEGVDELYVGGIWALRRSDSLIEKNITHVLSLVAFNPSGLKNFKDEPFSEYGKPFQHLLIDIDDVEDADLLVELPRAVKFIDEGLRPTGTASSRDDEAALETAVEKLGLEGKDAQKGGVFVHCAAGKSRSVSVIVAYLLWRYPNRFDPASSGVIRQSRKDTASEAVTAALKLIRRTRPMAEPNDGFMEQLALWWEMSCPEDVEAHPAYQRWAYKREVQEHLAVGQAPSRLRFEDEVASQNPTSGSPGTNLRCKKCRRTLATSPFILPHDPPSPSPSSPSSSSSPAAACQHIFIEPLSWMRAELEKSELSGRLTCPNARCGAGVGRYDWKGFRCSCGGWMTPGFSLQRARVDEDVSVPTNVARGSNNAQQSLGIRMPPGLRGGNL